MCKCTSFELAAGPLTKDLSSVVWVFFYSVVFLKSHFYLDSIKQIVS